jgi:alpha-tubulin suppressor-like RCC1 family protein
MSRPNQFLSPEGDIEEYFVDEYWLIDQWVGDTLWTWGRNNAGQLGNNTIVNRSTPVTTFAGGTNWKQVSGVLDTTVAIKTDGTLWTWGANAAGNLGDNTTTQRITPVTTFAGGTNWKQVACGNFNIGPTANTTAAIKTDGTLWTWGANYSGQLGNNNISGRRTPVTTFAGGTNWKQVACGREHTAAIKTDGTLWTWGGNANGQLGNNTTSQRNTPVTTFAGGTNWKQVACGNRHTAAVKTDGTLWTWGYNYNGQLGDNTSTQRNTPVTTFFGGTNWKQVSCGNNYTAAIKTNGTLWGWGATGYGRLGAGETFFDSVFIPIETFAGGTNWKQVSCGYVHTAAIKTDGTLWVWGRNLYGQLGNAQTTNRSTPVTTFAGGPNWKQVSSGTDHTAAVQAGINAEYPLS